MCNVDDAAKQYEIKSVSEILLDSAKPVKKETVQSLMGMLRPCLTNPETQQTVDSLNLLTGGLEHKTKTYYQD